MPTDVAIYASKLILEGLSFENINFITDPNIPIEELVSDPVYDFLSDFYSSKLESFIIKIKSMKDDQKLQLFGENVEKVDKMISSDFDVITLFSSIRFNPNYFTKNNSNEKDFKLLNFDKYPELYSMTGFRYIADTFFSWKIGSTPLKNFPLISPGMLKIWKNYFSESIFN